MDTLQPTSPRTEELDRLGDEIAELSAHLEAATGRLLDLIRAFDARGGWNTGFRSCAAWLSWRVGLDLGAARERVRVARALGALPGLAEALARGELSYAKVRALTRVATPATEARLLAIGRAGTASHVERIVRGWRHMDRRAEAREAARQHAGRALHVRQGEDGMVVLRGRLAPEVGALLLRALDAARETLYQRGRATDAMPAVIDPATAAPTRPQQQADALALLAETALHHELDPGAPGERYQVVVHVDAAVLADPEQPGQSVLEEGSHVSAETSRRLPCDASRVVMRHDEGGQVVEIGARTRTVPPALRRALHRDRSCRFPGCHVRAGQAHHVRHWAQGGPTTLSTLALLCRRHHRAVHEEGYQIARGPDGALQFRRPDGRPLPDVPPPAPVPADPVAALRARHQAEGLQLHARTGLSGWLGERLDVGWAIGVLRSLAGGGKSQVKGECMGTDQAVAQHYTHGGLERAVLDALRAAGKDPDQLEPGDLAPVDEFHIGGRQATIDFAGELRVTRGMHLLDIGSGLGGASRYFAHALGCTVTGIDLTEEYVRVAEALSLRTGLAGQVAYRQGSALALPFPAGTFDGAYMLHVGMNIADKAALFGQVRQALKPGGVFGVYDVMREREGALTYPVPWAAGPETSFLESSATYARLLATAGFEVLTQRSRREFAITFFRELRARVAQSGAPPLGLHIVMGTTTPQKIANMIGALEAGLISPTEIICRAGG